ncbi:MAG: signal peptide peptidase SppA [Clostridiales Family XIII bacterium]|jgi:protease-4|nr:signal peptide peptidase SppA [Clostridiales Family XIII bacterium]
MFGKNKNMQQGPGVMYASPYGGPGQMPPPTQPQGKTKWRMPSPVRSTLVVIAAVVLALIVLAAAGAAILSALVNSFSSGSIGAGAAFEPPGIPYVARISVVGAIGPNGDRTVSSDYGYHHDWTIETIDTLIGDRDNKAILLYLDTTGGTVYESDALYLKLMEYKEQTHRPIYAYLGSSAMSGGYYVAAAADEINANRNTWTGSIGVTIGTLFDVSDFLTEHGVKTETITSGRNKAMGSYFDPITDEQKEIFQVMVDEAYDQFVDIISESRGMEKKVVRSLADGRLYSAQQALGNGLIDGIMGEREAEAHVLDEVGGGVELIDAYYWPDTSFASSLGLQFADLSLFGLGDDSALKGDVAAVLDLVEKEAEAGAPQPMVQWTN